MPTLVVTAKDVVRLPSGLLGEVQKRVMEMFERSLPAGLHDTQAIIHRLTVLRGQIARQSGPTIVVGYLAAQVAMYYGPHRNSTWLSCPVVFSGIEAVLPLMHQWPADQVLVALQVILVGKHCEIVSGSWRDETVRRQYLTAQGEER